MDHDRLFKELLQTFFGDFIDLFLPDVGAYLDRDGLEFLDKEVFTDVTSGDRHEVDLLVKARFRGQDTFFLIHVENQSVPPRGEPFAARMFRYFARLHERFGLPVYPIAVLSYDAPLREEPARYQVAFPNRVVMDFSFDAIQLNRLNWRDFARRPNPVAAALMAKMRIAPEDRPRVTLECLRLLATLKLNSAKQALIAGFVRSYLRLSAPEVVAYNRELETIEPPEREAVMLIEDAWDARGAVKVILRQVRHRFGEVPAELSDRVRALPWEKFDGLADALLDLTSLADLQAWLDANG